MAVIAAATIISLAIVSAAAIIFRVYQEIFRKTKKSTAVGISLTSILAAVAVTAAMFCGCCF